MRLISSSEMLPVQLQKRCRRLEKIMSRIAPVVPTNTDTKVAATLSQVKASLGKVPYVFATLAKCPCCSGWIPVAEKGAFAWPPHRP
jgi:hypothetical protein